MPERTPLPLFVSAAVILAAIVWIYTTDDDAARVGALILLYLATRDLGRPRRRDA